MKCPTTLSTGLLTVLAALMVPARPVPASDWPTWRHDLGRTAATSDPLPSTLYPQWTWQPVHRPCPAWPDPVREENLMAFDQVFHVAIAGGRVFFASSADHQVRALSLDDGRLLWSFFTAAPVRFAPSVTDGKVYVAGDDGQAYCLDARTGRRLWQARPGPADRLMLGNQAMISRWPLRSGLVVLDGSVYLTAGMWPSMGVYVCSLDAQTGKTNWTLRADPAFAPQGYMTAHQRRLFLLAGRADAWQLDIDRQTLSKFKGKAQAIAHDHLYLTGPFTDKANENLPVAGLWTQRPRARRLVSLGLDTDKKSGHNFNGKNVAAVDDQGLYLAGDGMLTCYRRTDLRPRWQVPAEDVGALAAAGNVVVAAGRHFIAMHDKADGKRLWSATLDAEVKGLAIADGRVIASATDGRLFCFGNRPANPRPGPAVPLVNPTPHPQARQLARQIVRQTGKTAGFCLIWPAGNGDLAMALAAQTDLRLMLAEPDATRLESLRRRLAAAGLYGRRIVAHQADPRHLPYPDYFADLVIINTTHPRQVGPTDLAGFFRLMHPYGGKLFLSSPWPGSPLPREVNITSRSDQATVLTRGPLPDAGRWTDQYANPGRSGNSGDQCVRWPLEPLWFGEPGPGQMMNRHWRNSAPLCVDGRLFILGQHCLMAVDAYNGRMLWSHHLPAIGRRVVDIRGGALSTDGRLLYLATADLCLRFDVLTGQPLTPLAQPLARPVFHLAQPIQLDFSQRGRLTLRRDDRGLLLELVTQDTRPTNPHRSQRPTAGDSWQLFFDFRPPDARNGLPGPGAFSLAVVPPTIEQDAATVHPGPLSPCPPVRLIAAQRDEHGTRTTLRLDWKSLAGFQGNDKPSSFTFGAILNCSDDGTGLTDRLYRFANDASYRLANARALVRLVDQPAKAPHLPDDAALQTEHRPEMLTWGNLYTAGPVVLGTVVPTRLTPPVLAYGRDFSSQDRDYTGPPVARVLDELGLAGHSRHLFALDKQTGRLAWHYQAKGSIPHNGLAVWNERVYLIDGPQQPAAQAPRRRGRPPMQAPDQPTRLVVLDLASGRLLWQATQAMASHVELRLAGGLVLASHLNGLSVLDADDGRVLWTSNTRQPMHHCSAYVRTPILAGKWLYDEPFAYEPSTGRRRLASNGKPWTWGGFRGCGTVTASDHLLLFRTGYPAVLDLTGDPAVHSLPGIRPGCYINMITACGLLLMPEASSGCGCPYNFQTTLVLAPTPHRDD